MKFNSALFTIFVLIGCACNRQVPYAPGLKTSTPQSEIRLVPSATTFPTSVTTQTTIAPKIIHPPSAAVSIYPSCQPEEGIAPFVISEQPISSINPPDSAGLRALAERHRFYLGAAVSPNLLMDPDLSRLLIDNFNMVVPEVAMKWEVLHPEPERYDFTDGDIIVSFAKQQGMLVRGHVLVWGLQLPPWITEATHSSEEWMQILCTHIKTVVSHYQGHIYAWDVVNEAVNTDGTLYENFWLQRLGPDYIPMAFQWAREADEDARLFYNDNGGEGLNLKSQGIYTLIKGLKSAAIPIDGIGLQMHTHLYGAPSPEDLKANIQRLGDLGLEVQITEADVRIQFSFASNDIRLQEQAAVYGRIFQVCFEEKSCTAFLTWGLIDRDSWIRYLSKRYDAPLLFDDYGKPKPAYWSIYDVLSQP